MSLPKVFKKNKFLLVIALLGLFLMASSHVKAMYSPGDIVSPADQFPSYKLDIWEPAVYQTPEINQQSFSNETIYAVSASVTDQILGCVNCPQEFQQQGAVHGLGRLIAGMYVNPPASSIDYFADIGERLGIVARPAYAQMYVTSVGLSGLKPILPIWTLFRNIAYLFFVIVFILIGFAIMFRVKIDPQTVVSIQTALPKLVVALILVTFSYAIAGLLIDLIYVLIWFLFSLFRGQLTGAITSERELLGHNVFTAMWGMVQKEPFQIITAPASEIADIVEGLFADMPIISNIVGIAAGGLAAFVFAIAIAFAMFKLFFTLLICYITIILGVIFAPLMLALEAIPGQKALGNWIKMMIANIIPFPLVAVIFILTNIIVNNFTAYDVGWVAPFLGAGWGASYLGPLIGLGMVLLTPSIVDQVKKAIGAPGMGMAAGIGAPLAGAVGVLSGVGRAVSYPVSRPAALIREGYEKKWQRKVTGLGGGE